LALSLLASLILTVAVGAPSVEAADETIVIVDRCGRAKPLNLADLHGLDGAVIVARMQRFRDAVVCAAPRAARSVATSDAPTSTPAANNPPPPPAASRTFFIARDRLNELGEFALPPAFLTTPLGATLSPSADFQHKTEKLSAQAYVGWLLAGNRGSSDPITFGVGPAITLDGSYANPISKTSPALSSVRVGPDFQFGTHNTGEAYVYGAVAPFYQTDFRGDARAGGVDIQVEPYANAWALGGKAPPAVPDSPNPPPIGFYWQIVPEAQLLDVGTPGQTLYKPGFYPWLGGTAQATFLLFPEDKATSPNPLDRLSATVGYKYFGDAGGTRRPVNLFQAELDYKLPPYSKFIDANGIPSIGLIYSQGTDVETLQYSRQVSVQFSYKY
jgi:hypothetical protein